jgi:cytochrome b561
MQHYHPVSKALHWAIVLLVVAEFIVAWTMPEIRRGAPTALTNLHMSFGVTILLLMIVRAIWRFTHPAPPMLPVARGQRILAKATHDLLYLLLFLTPLAGWAFASGRGWGIVLYGSIPLPSIATPGSALASFAREAHELCATAVLVLVGLHVLAALYHHYVVKDGTLLRMLPRRASAS